MALTSVGFPGQVSAVEDAKRSKFQGAAYPVVDGVNDFAVTINNVSDRTVNIATGTAWAHGVMVTNDATATVTLDTVATAGQTRWDAVVLRRNWSGAGSVSVTKVNGTAALNAPLVVPTLNDNPGVLHDQLLAMAQVTNGQLSVTSVDPRRGWASKQFTFPSVSALPVAASVPYGTTALVLGGASGGGVGPTVGGGEYRRLLDNSANPAWIAAGFSAQAELTGTDVITAATGWTISGITNRALTNAAVGEVQLDLQIRRTGATMTADPDHGNFSPDVLVGTVAASLSPTNQLVPVFLQYAGGGAFTFVPGSARLETDGKLTLEVGTPSLGLLARAGASDVSVRASIRFVRKVS